MNKELSFGDILGIGLRRKWLLIVPAVVFCMAATGVSFFLPPKYTSQTLVLVEQPKVNDSIVKPAVVEDLDRRLSTMKEQILSRTRLQPIIQKYGLYKAELSKQPMEVVLDQMRQQIKVTPIHGANNSTPGFYIEFTDRSPKSAQDVCAEITSMFMEENLKRQEERAVGTTEFLANQLEEAKHKLDEQDAKLAAFQKQHLGEMPEQEQSNMNILMTTRSQLDAVTQGLAQARQDKAYVENLITQQEAALQASRTASAPLQTQDPAAVPSQDLETQLRKMKADLALLEARYQPDYPEVVRSKGAIAEMEKQLADERKAETDAQAQQAQKKDSPAPAVAATAKPSMDTPELMNLRNNLHNLETAIAQKSTEQEKLQKDVQAFESRVEATPKTEEDGKELTRDYQQAYAFYQDLLGKKTQSEMATDLERRQEGEQFRIMDPASLPARPSFPKPEVFAAGGFGTGLILGAILAFTLETIGKAIRSVSDVEFYLKYPLMANIPDLQTEERKARKAGDPGVMLKKLKMLVTRQPDTSGAVGA